jgi:hypothetical protein
VTNDQLARQFRAQADEAMSARKALLCASVAVATTSTIPAAIGALERWDGPAAVKAAAIELVTVAADVPGAGPGKHRKDHDDT